MSDRTTTIRAAIYARKSTEQRNAVSVTRQIDLARAFAKKQCWIVADEHVYVDDGISGAEFERRPGLQKLLHNRRSFQRLIVSEQKSLGRELSETPYLIKKLAQAGVEIVEYVHGQSLTPRDPSGKLISVINAFGDEHHRVKTSERSHESHDHKFQKGHVVGGRVFGYRNKHVFSGEDQHGNPIRSHTVREIDRKEAAVVVRIFELYASGIGLRQIAKTLNGQKALAPKPFVRKDPMKTGPYCGWAASTVRAILARELYRGVAVWNRSKKRDEWGQLNQQPRPASDWKRVEMKDLQIVSDELWNRVASRRADTAGRALRFSDGRLSGRPRKDDAKNLLAGIASCHLCGGGLVVETSGRKGHRVAEYVCYRHRHGNACVNELRMPVDALNEAVLRSVEEHALTPEAIESVIRLTERDDLQERRSALEREAKDVERRIKHVHAAIEDGGAAATLVARLHELEARQRAIADEIAGLRPVPRLAPQVVETRLAEWRRLLRQSTTQGRAVLQRILRGRITFTLRADGSGYDFDAPTRFDKLFSGVAVTRPAFVVEGDVRGTEHITDADTTDVDYGELLEKAAGKCLASPAGAASFSEDEKLGKCLASPTGFEPVF